MKRAFVTVAAALGALVFAAPAVAATTWIVDEDRADCPKADFNSIQAAVLAAAPGDKVLVCPGTYHEQVNVTKSDLRIEAQGKPGTVVLDGDLHKDFGFRFVDAHGNRLEGFWIQRFHEAGIRLDGSHRNTVIKNVSTLNLHDGIQVFTGSSFNLVEQNTTNDNLDTPPLRACGIQLSGGASFNVIRNNISFHNSFGIRLETASNGNLVDKNETNRNRVNGIWNRLAANDNVIRENQAFLNGTPTIGISAGIRLTDSVGLVVERNKAFANVLVDMFATAVAVFDNNHCKTSVPPGLCEHTEGAATHENQGTPPPPQG